jgi:hypothetical protein
MFRKIGLALLLCALGTSATAEGSSALTEKDVLSQQVRGFQTAKNCDGMIGLFYTQGVDDRRKSAFAKTIRETLCANFDKKINSIAFQSIRPSKAGPPGDFEGRHSAYTLDPVGVLVIDYSGDKPGETRSIAYRYGVHDNKAYLITTKNADAK